jgi:hypothetical protein
MTVIDNILNEWSFRCHDGVVDLNNHDKTMILREILDKESNNALDLFLEANMSSLADEAIKFIKDKYRFDDSNFKPVSKSSFKILIPDNFSKSRSEVMKDLEENPDFIFDQGSIGAGSSLGRLKYKDKVLIYIKSAKGQGGESAGKNNESSFISLINSHTTEGPITVVLKSDTKEEIYEGVIECKDSSKVDANEYAKADVQLINQNGVAANISLKKRNAVRWESSKRKLNEIFQKFIEKADPRNPQFDNVVLQPIPGANNKYKLFDPKNNKVLSKVVVINTPEELNDGFIFGKDYPKTIVVKEDFERFNNYTFENNILTINCYKIYTDVEDVIGTPDEPVLAFSNHVGQSYGIELRVFSKGLLYNEKDLKGSSTELNYNDIK